MSKIIAQQVIISDNLTMQKEDFKLLHSSGIDNPAYQDIAVMFMMYEKNRSENPDIFFAGKDSPALYCVKWSRELRKKQNTNITFISFLQDMLKALASSYIDKTVDLFIESESSQIPIYRSYDEALAYCGEVFKQKEQNAGYEEHDENEWRKGYFIYENLRIKQILKGGMGIVYIVNHLKTGETFAMKSIQQKFMWNNETYSKFIHEAETWINLEKHPNIVRALAVRQINSRPFIFLEYIPNGSLEDILKAGPISIRQAAEYALQTAKALSYAYQKLRLVHRDVKPSNCLINDKGKIKITDFGLAICSHEASEENVIQGTIQYMSPESVNGGNTGTPESDIYSFGVMLYYMLSGSLPYKADNIGELLVAFDRQIPYPQQIRPEVPDYLAYMAMKCLAPNPADRYHSFEEIERQLESFCLNTYGPPSEEEEQEEKLVMTAEDLLKKGQAIAELGKHYEAIEVYDDALKKNPGNRDIMIARGESLYTVGSFNEALKNFNEALKSGEDDGKIMTRKGDCFLALKRFQDALTCFNEAQQTNPDNKDTLISKSKYFLRTQKPRESIKLLDKVLELEPDSYMALFYKGAALLDLKEPEESIKFFKRSHDENPRCIEAWIQHSYVLYTIRRYNESARCMQQLLELAPDCKEAGLLFIKAKTAAGRYDEAMSFMEKKGLQNADQEELSIYADIQLEMKDYEGGLETLQNMLYLGNDNNDLLAITLMDRLLLFENAKNTCMSLISSSPDNADAAEIFKSIQRRESIFTSFAHNIFMMTPRVPSATEIIPEPPIRDQEIWRSLAGDIKNESYRYQSGAECYLKYFYEAQRQHNYWLALQVLKSAIETRNGNGEVWYRLAELLDVMGYTKHAIFAYYQFIYQTKQWTGWLNLSVLYENDGKYMDAALCGIQALKGGCPEVNLIGKIMAWLERTGQENIIFSISSDMAKKCRDDTYEDVMAKGILYMYAKRFTSAKNMFLMCRGDSEAELQMLKINLQTKNYAKAKQIYNSIRNAEDIREELLYYGAILMIDTNNADMAEELLNEACETIPEARILLAGMLTERGDKAAALELLQSLLSVKSICADASIWMAYIYRLENQLQKAYELMYQACAAMPENTELEWTRLLIQDMIAPGESIGDVEQFAGRHGMDYRPMHLLSYHYLLNGEMEKSYAILERALCIVPYDVEIINNLALLYLMEEEQEKAEKLLKKAMSHKKHSVSVINNMAVLLMEKEIYQEAIEILNLSSDQDYESKILQYSRSYGRFMTNRYAELIEETESEAEADYPRMLMGLVSCIMVNDKKRIESFAVKLRARYPDNPETWTVLGYIAMTGGKTNDALLFWQRALAQDKDNKFLKAAYAKAAAKLKRQQSGKAAEYSGSVNAEMQVNKDTLKKTISESVPLPQYIISKPVLEPKKAYWILSHEIENIFQSK
ncbi:MAG: protein kinase [bacterium]|nr:protein kinase [bacterium]